MTHVSDQPSLPSTHIVCDCETSGLSAPFDQVLAIGAVRTDASFTIAAGRSRSFEMACRPMPHVTPSPAALLKTRVTGEDLLARPHSVYDLMHDTQQVFTSWGSAVFFGFNNLRFDEHMLRQGLYQTLHHPYLTQSSGSTRADVMVMAQAISVLAPDAVAVPVSAATGRRSFALGPLCRQNGIPLAESEAHDALADVRATARLAAALKAGAPDAFARVLALAGKAYVMRLIRRHPVLFVLRMVGGVPCVRAVTPLGAAPGNPNGVVCVDLLFDPVDYLLLHDGELAAWAQGEPSPLVTIQANAQPMVFAAGVDMLGYDRLCEAFRRSVRPEGFPSAPLRLSDLVERADRVQSDTGFQTRLAAELRRARAGRIPPAHVEQAIYESFSSNRDLAVGAEMHRAFSLDRARYVDLFEDERLQEFATRWVHAERPDTLDPATRGRMDAWRRERVLGSAANSWRTVAGARLELAEIAKTAPSGDSARLAEIAAYLDRIEQDVRASA